MKPWLAFRSLVRNHSTKTGVLALDPVKTFIVLGGVFGLLFIFLTPPFQGSDEAAHFLRAYQVSEGNLVVDTSPNLVGGTLPASIYKTFVATTTQPVVSFAPDVKYDEHKTAQALSIALQEDKEAPYSLATTALYSPIAYFPASAAILVGRILNFPPIVLLYGARLADLLIWLLLIATAISVVPRRKWVFAFAGLIPMALFEASVLNTDAVTIGSSVLLICLILRFREQQHVLTGKQIGLLLAVCSVVVLSKQAMFVFLPLVLLLPSHLFQNIKKHIAYKSLLLAVPLLLFGLWSLLLRGVDSNTVYGHANGQDPKLQMLYILHHPFSYLHNLGSTYFNSTGDGILRSMMGVFGWVDTPLPWLIVVTGYVLLVLLLVGNADTKVSKTWITNKDKLILISVAVLYWLAVNTSLYLFYSPVGYHYVYGLQGRYFLPLVFLMIPLVVGSWLRYDKQTQIKLAVGGSGFLLIVSVITIISRYYVTGT